MTGRYPNPTFSVDLVLFRGPRPPHGYLATVRPARSGQRCGVFLRAVPRGALRLSAERSPARGGQRGDVLVDGREAGPHGVDAQMRGAGLAPVRDLLIDRR